MNAKNTAVIQTFDFGYPPNGFGHFQLGEGDGGQIIKAVDNWLSIVMTQDGGCGIQWFIGANNTEAGWLLFRGDVDNNWRDTVAWLNKSTTSNTQPWLYNAAYTRYKRATLTIPFLKEGVPAGTKALDTIIVEHYGGDTIETADAVECFYFAKGYGWIRWERWLNSKVTTVDMTIVNDLTQTTRMPIIPEMINDHDANWHMVDGRTWTNWVSYPTGYTVEKFGWQAGLDVT